MATAHLLAPWLHLLRKILFFLDPGQLTLPLAKWKLNDPLPIPAVPTIGLGSAG